MRRHETTDEEWELVRRHIKPRGGKTGRKPKDLRVMLNGCLWVLRTGAPWRDLPERFGKWRTVYDYFAAWRADGTFDRILRALHIRLDRDGKIDWDLWCVDGSSIRASRAAAGAPKKASRTTKTSRKTTLWAAREADSAASCTWLLMAEPFR